MTIASRSISFLVVALLLAAAMAVFGNVFDADWWMMDVSKS